MPACFSYLLSRINLCPSTIHTHSYASIHPDFSQFTSSSPSKKFNKITAEQFQHHTPPLPHRNQKVSQKSIFSLCLHLYTHYLLLATTSYKHTFCLFSTIHFNLSSSTSGKNSIGTIYTKKTLYLNLFSQLVRHHHHVLLPIHSSSSLPSGFLLIRACLSSLRKIFPFYLNYKKGKHPRTFLKLCNKEWYLFEAADCIRIVARRHYHRS